MLLSAIGDVVHGMPVATSLRRAWPDARVSWVIQPGAHALVAPHPAVDEFLRFDRSGGARAFLDFRRTVAGRRFDVVLALQVYFKAGLLTGLLPASRKVGFDRARARDANWLFTSERIQPHAPQHVQDQYFEFLDHLGVPAIREWEFAFSPQEEAARRDFYGSLERPALAVIVGTTRPEKNWPPERYARVLEAAEADFGLQPLIVGSESPMERRLAEEVVRQTRARPIVALRNDLRRLAWLIDSAALLLSPDTGPLHIAAALGTPVIGLFGATDPKRVGPYRGPRDLVIDRYTRPGETVPSMRRRPGNMERITVDDVLERLQRTRDRYL